MKLQLLTKSFLGYYGGLLTAAAFSLMCSCNSVNQSTPLAKPTSGSIIEYANHFSIVEKDSFTIVTVIDPWQGSVGKHFRFYLVGENNKMPKLPDSAVVVRIPISKIICTSTTHLSMIKVLGEEGTIKGFSGGRFIFDPKISSMFESGHVADIGYDAGLNIEKIMDINPNLMMMYGVGGESAPAMSKLNELGIRVLFNADYLEEDPLGKAEWIKLFGALYNKSKAADSIFSSIANSYNLVKKIVHDSADNYPRVMLGLPYRDAWYVSPGNSYISQIIEDAGGAYIWADISSDISMPYGLESVFERAVSADFWLNPGSAESLSEIIALDSRFSNLPPVKNSEVYNNNKRMSDSGGNDYWESGSVRQDLILQDMASILHPELFENYVPYYYKKLK